MRDRGGAGARAGSNEALTREINDPRKTATWPFRDGPNTVEITSLAFSYFPCS